MQKTANLTGLLFSFFTTFLLFFAYLDKTALLPYHKCRKCTESCILSFVEIHISQAQVSRLEKGALEHIRKQI